VVTGKATGTTTTINGGGIESGVKSAVSSLLGKSGASTRKGTAAWLIEGLVGMVVAVLL